MEYSFFYKTELPIIDSWDHHDRYDLFLSAFNSSERVNSVYLKANSIDKYWLIFPEYHYLENELPNENTFCCQGSSEGDQILSFFNHINLDLENTKICIDITGFMRPQLAFIIKFLYINKIKKLDLIYSEPEHYSSKEKTEFSDGNVLEIRQIIGFEGTHTQTTTDDLLIIGSGYDHNLIKSVCNDKEHAKIKQLIGFPSLRPDMYQENLLKTGLASDALGNDAVKNPIFAPANDPFITASVLRDTIIELNKKSSSAEGISNLYLCPLSTKPQTVGFVLYYLKELQGMPASIIYPFFTKYERETSKGINKIWLYTVEFS